MIQFNNGEKEQEKVEKAKRKKLNLNNIKYILKNIKDNNNLKVGFTLLKELIQTGLIISPLLITIIDITAGYDFSWKTIIHIFGCGSCYYIIDDIISKIKQ